MRRALLAGGLVVSALVGLSTPVAATPGDVDLDLSTDQLVRFTVGPDGDLWATSAGDAIVHLDPDTGQVVETFSDVEIDSPTEIVSGPDGRLWFANAGSATLGALDPDTDVTATYPYPSGLTFIDDLVVGPDDRLWFVDTQGGAYGAVTDAGTFTQYDDSDVSAPSGLALGPGGTSLWLVDIGFDAAAEVDAEDGSVTPIPYAGLLNPNDLIAGPTGDLWITSYSSGITRLDPMGTYTPVADPADGGYDSIAIGPDGEVWAASSVLLVRADPATNDLDHYFLPAGTGLHNHLVTEGERLWLLGQGEFDSRLGTVELDTAGSDTQDPTVDLRSPTDGHAYLTTDGLVADYDCPDTAALANCVAGYLPPGQVFADGDEIDLFPSEGQTFDIYARDTSGNTTFETVVFSVDPVCRGQRATFYNYSRVSVGAPTSGRDVGWGEYLLGKGGNDRLCSYQFADGGPGHDALYGTATNGRLNGGSGNDRIAAGGGNDRIFGGAGADRIDGGPGQDVCIGAGGYDTFVNCELIRQG